MADKQQRGERYRVQHAAVDEWPEGTVIDHGDLGERDHRRLLRLGAIREATPEECAAWDAALEAQAGGIEDQAFHQTLADQMVADVRQDAADDSAKAKATPVEGAPESPRVTHADVLPGDKKGK